MTGEGTPAAGNTPRPRSERSFWAWLAFLAGSMAALGFFGLGRFPARGVPTDVAMNGLDAINALQNGIQTFYGLNGGREGGMINLVAASFSVFGVGSWQIRVPSVLCGILGVVLLGLLGRRLFGPRAGLAAAFLAVSSPGFVMVARSGYRASMVPAAACLALLSFLWAKDRARPEYWGLAGVAAGLGFHTYTSWPVIPAVLAAYALWLVWRHRVRLLPVALWATFMVMTALPVVIPKYVLTGGGSRGAELATGLTLSRFLSGLGLEFRMFLFRGDTDWRNNLAGLPLLPLLGGLLLVLGAWLLFRELRDPETRERAALLFLLLVLGTVPAALTPLNELPMYLRSSVSFPAVFLMGGIRVPASGVLVGGQVG